MSDLTLTKSKLVGSITVSGAKNSILRLLASSILTSEDIIIGNYPSSLLDAKIHLEMLKKLGKKYVYIDNNTIKIPKNISSGLYFLRPSLANKKRSPLVKLMIIKE